MSEFSLIHWLIVAGVGYVLYRALRPARPRASDPMVCLHCGTVAPPVVQTRGHFALEVVLWLLLIVPGIIYSIWRLASRRDVCGACSSANLVSPATPAGKRQIQLNQEVGEGGPAKPPRMT
jgi:uncharacterized membrane protein YqaE (UPF0057 family)